MPVSHTSNRYKMWKKEFQTLKNDIDNFRAQYNKMKRCNCEKNECSHYKRKRNKLFGTQIDKLYDEKMYIGFSTFNKIKANDFGR